MRTQLGPRFGRGCALQLRSDKRMTSNRMTSTWASSKKPKGLLPYLMLSGLVVTAFGFWQSIQSGVDFPFWRPSTWFMTWGLGLFVSLLLAVGVVGPLVTGILMVGLLGVWTSAIFQIAVLIVFLIAMSAFGSLVTRATEISLQNMLVGIVIVGTIFGFSQSYTVHTDFLWGPVLAASALVHIITILRIEVLRRENRPQIRITQVFYHDKSLFEKASWAALLALVGLHALTASMPEIGHDALATHLYVPLYVEATGHWRPDPNLYVWSYMPSLFVWSASPLAVLGGEVAVRYFSFALVLLLARLSYEVARWVGLSEGLALWSPIAFLSTPLVYLMSTTIYSDPLLSLLVWSGAWQLVRSPARLPRTSMLTAGVLLGGAVSTKSQALPILAVFFLCWILYQAMSRALWKSLGPLAVLGLVITIFGSPAYVRAFIATGNPVFPFYNDVFKSPYYSQTRFSHYAGELVWNTPYLITFESSRYLGGSLGSPGFAWLIVVVPVVIVSLFSPVSGRVRLVVAALAITLIAIFPVTAYLRYVLPAALAAAVLVPVSFAMVRNGLHSAIGGLAVSVLLVLNLVHLDSATWHGRHDLAVLRHRDAATLYVAARAPVRAAIQSVNRLAGSDEYVAIVGSSLPAGLVARPLMASWYNTTFQQDVAEARVDSDVIYLISARNISAVIGSLETESFFLSSVSRLCARYSSHGSIAVWNCTGLETNGGLNLLDTQ